MALTTVRVCFHAVAVLQAGRPCSLVFRARGGTVTRAVAALEALGPLSAVDPTPLGLHPEPVSLALGPLALEAVTTGPRVDSADLETELPSPGVLALTLRSRADAESVRLAVLPAPAVRAPVIEIISSPSAHSVAESCRLPAGKLGVTSLALPGSALYCKGENTKHINTYIHIHMWDET